MANLSRFGPGRHSGFVFESSGKENQVSFLPAHREGEVLGLAAANGQAPSWDHEGRQPHGGIGDIKAGIRKETGSHMVPESASPEASVSLGYVI